MIINKQNKRIEIWGKAPFVNELLENDFHDDKIMTIWASVVPQTNKLGRLTEGQAHTIIANTSHKIICRYSAGKDIKQDMWIIYKSHRFDINYILNPFFSNESLEIFCTEVID